MAYNLTFTPAQWPGHVPFVDTDHLRFIRGGLTIDAAQVNANRAASQGQVALVNGLLTLLQGSYISENPGTGRYEMYVPVMAAQALLNIGVVGDDNAITWEAVDEGVAGNNITLQFLDTRVTPTVLACNVVGTDITITLADDGTGVFASGNTGAADSEILWTSELPGVDGNVISIIIIDDGTLARAAIDVQIVGSAIHIFPVTDGAGAITSIANAILAEVNADPVAGALVQGAAVGAGTDPVAGEAIALIGGVDSVPASTALQVMAIVAATPAAAALVAGANTGASSGAGVCVPMAQTNLADGADGSNAVAAGLRTGISDLETAINWRSAVPGVGGNAVTITYADPLAPAQPLAVTAPGGNILVSLATDAAGAVTSTAAEIVAAALLVGAVTAVAVPSLACAIGNGVVQPMAATTMTGGIAAGAANIANRYACILFEDVTLVDSQGNLADAIATGIDHGRVLTARLPLAPDATVRAALTGVIFK